MPSTYVGTGDQEDCAEQYNQVTFIRLFVHVYTVDHYLQSEALIYVHRSQPCTRFTSHLQPHHTNSCAKCQHEEAPRPPHRFSTARLLLCLVCNTTDCSSTASATDIICRATSTSIALTTQEPPVRASIILSACGRRGIGIEGRCRSRRSDAAGASDCDTVRDKRSAVACRA